MEPRQGHRASTATSAGQRHPTLRDNESIEAFYERRLRERGVTKVEEIAQQMRERNKQFIAGMWRCVS
jgi:hypothetical protein